jgi:iron complex transport system substrate-binding protein
MKRLLAALLLLVAGGAMAVTDDRGVDVQLHAPPKRVVSMLPSVTESICEMGACDRLVGVDDFSNWPARVKALPHLGGLADASIERIVALRPDLVILDASTRALPRLQALGIPVAGFDIKTLEDMDGVLQRVGLLLGVQGADALRKRIATGIDSAVRSLPPQARGLSVYFEVDEGLYAAGVSSHIGELLVRLGAVNIVPADLGSVPKLNPEFVVRADPQVIMVGARNAPLLAARPGWSRIRAVREGHVCAFTRSQADVVVRPGPRVAEAAQLMADCLAGRLPGAGR